MARVLVTLYDVLIVIPLLIERASKAGLGMRRGAIDADDSSVHPVR
jgi:hypothetical protein